MEKQQKENSLQAVCVFCGASNAAPQKHLDAGTAFGKLLVKENLDLVYGGGDCGVMGAVANAALDEGGRVIGVFPEGLQEIEKEHTGLTEIYIVDTMHQRKQLMYEKSDAFVILPGGFGTMDEMFEIITWRQLRMHRKPIIVFNHDGYWDALEALMTHIIERRFASEETATYFRVVTQMEDILPAIHEMRE